MECVNNFGGVQAGGILLKERGESYPALKHCLGSGAWSGCKHFFVKEQGTNLYTVRRKQTERLRRLGVEVGAFPLTVITSSNTCSSPAIVSGDDSAIELLSRQQRRTNRQQA